MPPEPSHADWRAQLDALGIGATAPHDTPVSSDREPSPFRALALQFELRRRRARRDGDWKGPRDEPAKSADAVDRLAVRPVSAGARNGWVKAGLTWQNIAFQGASQGYDAEQARWFAHFALLKGRTPSVYTTYGSEWITLDEYESPILWAQLADAARLGIALVGSGATPAVRLAPGATVALDARYSARRVVLSGRGADVSDGGSDDRRSPEQAGGFGLDRLAGASGRGADGSVGGSGDRRSPEQAGDLVLDRLAGASGRGADVSDGGSDDRRSPEQAGDLVLDPVVAVGDRIFAPAHSRPIGTHGVYAFDVNAGELVLAPVHAPAAAPPASHGLTDAQLSLLDHPTSIRIAPADTAAFLRTAYPRLAANVPLLSLDGSFEPPPPVPAMLVLEAKFEPDEVLRLAWHWEHSDGRRTPIGDGAATTAPATGDGEPGSAGPDDPDRDPALDRALDPALDPDLVELARDELGGIPMTSMTLRGDDVAWFADRVIRRLRRLDRLRVDVTGDPPDYREAGPAHLAVTTVESDKTDWFDLGVVVTVNGRKVPFMPLFRALAKGRRRLLLVDKTYLDLTQPVFEPLRDLIEEAGTLREWETGVRIHRSQVGLWAEFEDLADEAQPAVSWRSTVAGLTDGATTDLPAPATLAAELRPYQLDGFRWLALLWSCRLGGVLADDMGLGKTVQTLALVAHARATDASGAPFLVVAPTSVASNWVAEAARFTPGLRVASVTATDATRPGGLAAAFAAADLVVTTYAVLRLDIDRFAAREWDGLILDEAQFVKNPATKVHDAARAIRAPFRLALTGTPIENHTGELWAILRLVAPGLFPSRRAFDERYRRPIEAGHRERLERLRRRIRPLMLRRTKEEVAPELPPKQEQVLTVELTARHRRLYDATLQRERTKLLGLVDDLDRQRHIVYRSLTLLRMLALDASLIDDEHRGIPSAKLDALFEQLEDVLAEGHRALVFSQFTSFLGRVGDRLGAEGVPFAWIDGSTPARRRDAEIARFRSGAASVFCISLKAGGFGLNLTEADYVFLLDPWWNPASEEQAVDRAHRIGQDKQVMVYRLVAADTIEEKVMALKRRKGEVIASVLDPAGDPQGHGAALTANDLKALLTEG